jgi:RimK family alpha-L-glutamate ligase
MRVAVVAHRASQTNVSLAARTWGGLPVELLAPREALLALRPGDSALARLDVRDDLAGAEEGLTTLERLADSGVNVLNPPAALLRAHDKLLTARTLRRAGLPHPRTKLVERHADLPDLDFPVVVKPRFGSWGRDVCLCEGRSELERTLGQLAARPWFRSGGAIAQELIPPLGHDLRVIVARGAVVGSAVRTAPPGEWRTNAALGATVSSAVPSPVAVNLAQAAAAASGLDLVGVDLLPTGPGGFCVLELNGAVDFRPLYAPPGRDVYADALNALAGSPDADALAGAAADAG